MVSTSWIPIGATQSIDQSTCTILSFVSTGLQTPESGQQIYIRIVATRNSNFTHAVTIDNISITQPAATLTYSWSPVESLNNHEIANPIATPTGTTNYTLTVTNSNGCFSTDDVEVIVNPIEEEVELINACDSYVWNGETYTESGVFYYLEENENDCDVLHALNLSILHSSEETVYITSEGSYTWALTGQTYETSGEYTHIGVNEEGCELTTTLNLTIQEEDGIGCMTTPTTTVSNITKTTADVTWEGNTNSTKYKMVYQKIGSSTLKYKHIVNDVTTTLTGLEAGSQYVVRVKSLCSETGKYTAYSPKNYFTTEEDTPCNVAPELNIDNVTETSVTVSWIEPTGASKYKIVYQRLGTSTIKNKTVQAGTSSLTLSGLVPNSEYVIRIRSTCASDGTNSGYGTKEYFITTGEASNNRPAFENEIDEKVIVANKPEVIIYPNPTSGAFNINVVLNDETAGDAMIQVTDLSGRIVNITNTHLDYGFNSIKLDISDVTAGLYNVILVKDGVILHKDKIQKR